MSGTALAEDLRRIGAAGGLDAVGIASAEPFADARQAIEERRAAGLAGTMQFTYRNPARSTDPAAALRGARSLVVGARRYLRRPPAPESAEPSGGRPHARVARYAWSDHYADLRAGLALVAERLRADGHRTIVLADDNSLVDRAAAARAGIGWYGKNTLLLRPGEGSWFVLGSVVTDAVLPPDAPVADGCGTCSRCLPACPTGALVAPGVLDGRRCLAWLVQAPGIVPRPYREAIGDRIYGCDDCQDVCPVNRLGTRRRPPREAAPEATAEVDVVALLQATDTEILRRFGRWYIAERDPRYLRRNALVVLGNTASPTDPDVVAVLRAALLDADGLIRAHAVWAAARLGRADLIAALVTGDDPDPDVQAELAAAAGGPATMPAGEVVAVEDRRTRPPEPRPVGPPTR